MKLVIFFVALAAILLGGAILVAAPGTRLGLWEYSKAFEIYRLAASPKDIAGPVALSPVFAAAGLAFAGGLLALFTRRGGLGVFALVAAIMAGGAGMIPVKMRQMVEANPFIHDITTDFENPPAIVAGAEYDRNNPPDYVGDEQVRDTGMTVAEAQRKAFPDIAPITVDAGVEETAETVREIVEDMNMDVLQERTTENGWVLEAAYTSMWFGFVDDFVVRLTDEGGATRVDVRSKSRVGGSDLGANAERVREFMRRLAEATA